MKAIGSAGFLIAGIAIAYAQADIAPTGTLRAAYLATNPAQAIRDAHTGEVRGVSFDVARELAKRIGKPLDFKPTASPPVVIDAVRSGQADIGFVAYEATRLGTVEFSQTYAGRAELPGTRGFADPCRCRYRPHRSEGIGHVQRFHYPLSQAHA